MEKTETYVKKPIKSSELDPMKLQKHLRGKLFYIATNVALALRAAQLSVH